MVNQQYNGYDSAKQEELRGALVYGEEPVKGDRHGRCTGKNKVLRGIMYVSFIRTSEFLKHMLQLIRPVVMGFVCLESYN